MDEQGLNDAAIMLMSLGEEEAAEVFKHFSPKEVQKLGETIARMRTVSREKVDEVINKFSKDIAVYNLFSRIGIDEGTDQKTYLNRYNAAIKFFELVADGKVSIGTEADDPASAAATGFSAKSNTRLFTRGSMRGM